MILWEEDRVLPMMPGTPVLPSDLQKILMKLSAAHADRLGAGWTALRELGVFWVVSRFRMRFLHPLRGGEKVTLQTWPNRADVSGVDRNFRVFSADGILAAEAMCRWVIVRIADGKPVKAVDFPLLDPALDYLSDRVWSSGCGDFPVVRAESDRILERPVVSDDIDENLHVNNVRYVVFAQDALASFFPGTPACREFGIRYLAQAFSGENLEIRVHSEEKSLGCEGSVLRDGVRVKVFRCVFEP